MAAGQLFGDTVDVVVGDGDVVVVTGCVVVEADVVVGDVVVVAGAEELEQEVRTSAKRPRAGRASVEGRPSRVTDRRARAERIGWAEAGCFMARSYSGGEVLGSDVLEEVSELTDDLLRTLSVAPVTVGVVFMVVFMVVFIDRQHDAFGIHQLVRDEER